MGSVTVKLFGFFIDLVGESLLAIKFEGIITLRDLIDRLDEKSNARFKKNVRDPKTGRLCDHVILLLNGKDVTRNNRMDMNIKNEDEVGFYPIATGG